ncbi:ficolin-2-like [Rhagoletis pomonella]|uniref:ficolin-2-like n=1 Tax=Rhagoletis pomonella TaxID=28610 RepID=UPI00178671B1|nr:ficolin-2-like [Rhagoletis pomonella]
MFCLRFCCAILVAVFATSSLANAVQNVTDGPLTKNSLARSVYASSLPRSCAEAFAAARSAAQSGIYQLYLPEWFDHPFYVYCLKDPNGGDAWTVFQRRQDGLVNFYRTWRDYQTGFGNLDGNFFIGLDQLHALTQVELQELWIEMMDYTGTHVHANYESFAVGDEEEKYALNIIGKYSGTAGEALKDFHDGQKFSTFDEDNDEYVDNCAEVWKGAWWYKDCWWSNLNGMYNNSLFWNGRYPNNMKYTHMAIRPKKRL